LDLLANVIAILAAPIVAVVIAQRLQNRRIEYDRRYMIYRILMGERMTPVSPAAVGALNLIDVEYKRFPRVLASWRDYYDLVDSPGFLQMDPARQTETSKRKRSQLLLEMTKALGIKGEFTLDDLARAYRPKALADPEATSTMIMTTVGNAIKDHGGFPVVIVQPQLPRPLPQAPPPQSNKRGRLL
jgi:hypothetical protein